MKGEEGVLCGGEAAAASHPFLDDKVEWLDVYYETPMYVTEINIIQTYNPDQVARVDLIDLDGEIVPLYTQEPHAVERPCPYIPIDQPTK
jgi:hypothetical protein